MARSAEGVSVETIMTELRPQAEREYLLYEVKRTRLRAHLVSIPPKVKQEILAMIRQYIEKQVEG